MNPLDVVQQWYQTRNAALLHPQLEWQVLEHWPAGGHYRTPEKVLSEFFPKLLAHFEWYQAVPRQYYSSGNTVLVSGVYKGVGKRTGKSFSTAFVHIWTLEDNCLVRFRQVADTAAVQEVV